MQAKSFIAISTLIFLIVAAAHAWRLYQHVLLQLGSHVIPLGASWLGLAVAVVLAIWGIALLRR